MVLPCDVLARGCGGSWK
uniref:Uncharacterized protein n=1 Tax=Anguilla anguilla TaxID=7936 RepID=A0A0E9RSL2_ANGAN